MSTNDVPGHKPENNDELAMGAWAEHEDGSLILVESVEGGRVIYSVFDMEPEPITEYRDAMPQDDFEERFSWDDDGDRWTWHDKTPFPWDRVIRQGSRAGERFASADDLENAATRVARSRKLRGSDFQPDEAEHRRDQLTENIKRFARRIQRAIDDLGV